MKKVVYLLIMFTVLAFSLETVKAQETRPLTLEELVQIALKNNSQLRNAKRLVDRAGTNVTLAWSSVLPKVNSSFSSGRLIQGERVVKQDVPVGEDELGRTIYEQRSIKQDQSERNSHSARVSLSQNIYDFGRSTNSIKQAKANEGAYEHYMINTRQTVVLNVKRAYFELLKSYRLEDVYQEAVDLAAEQVGRAQTMLEIGSASQAEVFQAKVNLGSQKMNLIQQKNVVEIARANLNNALGQNPSTPLEVVTDETEPIFPGYEFEEAVKIAIENNKDIKSQELQVLANRYGISVEKARYLPQIGLGVTYSRNNDEIERVYSSNLDQDFTVSLGASLDLNIFNGFSDKAAVQRETLNYQIALEDLSEQKRLLTADVKQYFLELQAYQDILEINRENIEAAKENLRLQQEKRRVGSGTELEVTQAQVELTQAQSNFVRAEYDAKVSKADLEAAMGIIE